MRLTVLNASPRGDRGNTARILDALIEGFESSGHHQVDRRLLSALGDDALVLFATAEVILLAFPLYVYSLPAGALRWTAQLAARQHELRTLAGSRKVTLVFLVQYGFSEAIHGKACERQLRRMTETLGLTYGGTVIRGGSEGLQSWPRATQNRYMSQVRSLGVELGARGGTFDQASLDRFAGPDTVPVSGSRRLEQRLFALVANLVFWRPQLARNRALAHDRDRPLEG